MDRTRTDSRGCGMARHPALSDGLDPVSVGRALWRGRVLIAFCALIGLGIGALRAFHLSEPLYNASAVIVVEAAPAPAPGIETTTREIGRDVPALETELLVLRSRAMLGEVVDALGLAADPAFGAGSRARAIDALLHKTTAALVGRARAFRIAATTRDPHLSAQIANALADAYLADQIARKAEAHDDAAVFLAERAAALGAELAEREAALAAFRDASGAVSDEALSRGEAQLRERRARLGTLGTELAQARARAHLLGALLRAGDLAALTEAADDPGLRRALGTPRERLAAEGVVERAVATAARIEGQHAPLDAATGLLAEAVSTQAAGLIRLRRMERETDAARLLHETVLARLAEASMGQGLGRADARILSPAVPRLAPVAPRASIAMLGGLLGGMAAGMLGAGLLGLARRGASDMCELREATGRRVITAVARGGAVEGAARLRALLRPGMTDGPRTLLIAPCSGTAEPGLADALAASLSRIGQSVLLIDAAGARGDETADDPAEMDAVMPGMLPDPATGGDRITLAPGPDALAGPVAERLLGAARARWDAVLIAAPSVLDAPAACTVAGHVDAAILTVAAERTPCSDAAAAAEALEAAGVTDVSLVLTQARGEGGRGALRHALWSSPRLCRMA